VIKRRAQTRLILKKFTSAEQDVRRAIKIVPTDKEAKVMLEKILHPERFLNDKEKEFPYEIKSIKKPTGVNVEKYQMTKIPIKILPDKPKQPEIQSSPKNILKTPVPIQTSSLPDPATLSAPKTSFELFQILDKYKKASSLLPPYLLKIKDICNLVNDQLESAHAVLMITAFRNYDEDIDQVISFLTSLRKIPRLSMILLMLDDKTEIEQIRFVGKKYLLDFDL